MQFYDSTNKRGICQKIDRLCDTNDTSYPRLNKTAEVNDALEKVVGWIIGADGNWQWDDSNRSDLPIGLQTLVAGQSAYTFNDKFLQILEIQVQDINGNWVIIRPIDQSEYSNKIPLEEAFENDALPIYYDKVSDDTIKLYPAPSATTCVLVNGLKVKFKRTAQLFTPVATTAEDITVPGFISTYHDVLAYMAAIPYCITYKKDRVALYMGIVGDTEPPTGMKKQIIKAYSQREKDTPKIMQMARLNKFR